MNELISNQIRMISDSMVEIIHKYYHPLLILLVGSAGRDEVIVSKVGNQLVWLSDIEFLVVKKSNRLQKAGTSIDEDIADVSNKFSVKIDLIVKTPNKITPRWRPHTSLAFFDYANGSKVLYQSPEDTCWQQLQELKSEEIPVFEGIRLVSNRIAETLLLTDRQFLSNTKQANTEQILFFISKIISACQDSLLIYKKCYTSSYFKRFELLAEKNQQGLFPLDISKQIDTGLFHWANHFRQNKISTLPEGYNHSQLWFDVVALCGDVMGLVDGYGKVNSTNCVDFANHYIDKYCHTGPRVLYHNFQSFKKLLDNSYKINISVLLIGFIKWRRLINSLAIVLYFSLSENFVLNGDGLQWIATHISRFNKDFEQDVISKDELSSWETYKDKITKIWLDLR